MEKRRIDGEIVLVPYYPNYGVTQQWYSDVELCKQVDNREHIYSLEELTAMYEFLNTNGDCYYIEYNGKSVGDITLRHNFEICIVISREYQNKHIGRRCVREIMKLASEKNYGYVKVNIYSFNSQSRAMFLSLGFEEKEKEWFYKKI